MVRGEEMKEQYIVNKFKDFPGLTVTNYVFKPGMIFTRDEWKWGDEALAAAIKNGRCSLVEDEEGKAKKSKSSVTDIEKIQKQLDKLLEKYSSLDAESEEAQKLEEKIKKLEEKIK
jgi:pyruvate/2-oxoacid:ferredoxin oxidoreductase beta subunit